MKTDRIAIEALARELTDEQWDKHLRAAAVRARHPGMVPTREDAALLAYLDEVWAGLGELYQDVLREPGRLDDTDDPIACGAAVAMEAAKLVRFNGYAEVLPLGRAVLRRAQERDQR